MPKATLHYELPQEKGDFEIANKATEMHAALADVLGSCRHIIKYESDPVAIAHAEYMRDKLWEALEDRGLRDLLDW